MSHNVLALIAIWEIRLFLGGLAAAIALKLLTGRINLQNLFYGRRGDRTPYFSPERVQLLVATLSLAMEYLMISLRTATGEMPKLPDGALGLLGASNAIYLGGKALAFTRKTLPGQETNP